MGAIFFYIFVYFLAYYSTYVINLLSVRPLISNRFIAGLVPVILVSISHGYFIATSPPPQGTDISVMPALMSNVIMPVVIFIIGVLCFMWKKKNDDEEEEERARKEALEDEDDYDDNDYDENDTDSNDDSDDEKNADNEESDIDDDKESKEETPNNKTT